MKEEPLVMCLTNTVAANFTANCLLAIGARPAMLEEPVEAQELAADADAILVNLGTLNATQAEAMRRAVGVANTRHIPWVLDPVGVQLLSYRRQFAEELLSLHPTLIRGNHGEIDFLNIRDADATILSTGETDCIFAQGNRTEITGGSQTLQRTTATGCAQGGICAAFLGMGMTPMEAAIRASRLLKLAGERAAETSIAPGAFQAALLDQLFNLTSNRP